MTEGGVAVPGTLFIVSTPIGNLADLSARAIVTMQSVRAVLAEDTRHSRPLLEKFGVQTSLMAYHEHNEAKATPTLIARLLAGDSFALISDAGTPLLSDPGARLVRAAIEAGVTITPIPGASALLAALVARDFRRSVSRFSAFSPERGGSGRKRSRKSPRYGTPRCSTRRRRGLPIRSPIWSRLGWGSVRRSWRGS